MRKRRLVTRPALAIAAAGGGGLIGAAAGTVAASAYIARRVLTPEELMPDDTHVIAFDAETVTVGATPETVVPGRYGLWLDGGRGHCRVGDIVSDDLTSRTASVTRSLIAVDRGELAIGQARWNQYYWWDRPSISLGIPDEDVMVHSELGALPGWLVSPDPGGAAEPSAGPASGDWAVLVHGRGAQREETLRAVPVLRAAGWTSLVATYRNDLGAPRGPDGRYNLGLSEWRDIDAALTYAVSHGAQRIVLLGWSMGGAIVLQVLAHSPLADRVVGVCLNSPVVDWGDVLGHHARGYRVPGPFVVLTKALMASSRSRRLVGVDEPVDVALTDWVTRSPELRHRMLLIASDADDFVPIGPAAELARRRPDLVRLERWDVARHCREWNVDPDRWERVLREFLADL